MANVELIKKLRAITHAPLKDCKSALEESWGDMDRAQEILREKWALKAAKNADRETNEWTVTIVEVAWKVAWIKLACETDFVAKNPLFLDLATQVATIFGEWELFEWIDNADPALVERAEGVLKDNFVTIGENMKIVDAFALDGNCFIYRHPGDKVAAVVFFEGDAEKAKAVALQAAAMNPLYLSVEDLPADEVAALKEKFIEELADSNKPDDIKEKIVEGRLQKEWKDIVLLEQPSIVDDTKLVRQLLGDTVVTRFIRYAI